MSSTAQTEFLQRRVAAFGAIVGGGGLAFFVFRLIGDSHAEGFIAWLLLPDTHFHVVGAAFFLSAWVLCRRGTRSSRFVRTVEAVSLVGGCSGYAVMAASIPPIVRPDLILLLIFGFGMFGRAAYVPSSARRTFALSAVVAIPMLASVITMGLHHDPALYSEEARQLYDKTPREMAAYAAVNATAWWALITLLAAGASRVIYGLRADVRKARQLGQYTLEEKLGEGGMGAVYRARHAMLRRPTAIKLLPPEKSGEAALVRFEREVQLTAQLSHPNIVTIYDYGRTPDGVLYYAMEVLEGATLEDVVELGGELAPERVVYVLTHLASALVAAHGVRLIHRDIKPSNVILCEQGGVSDVPKLVDFGLVKEIDTKDPALTDAGAVTGTPLYMSPEALTKPDSVDGRADLYCLGAVGYYLLTGAHVFDGESVIEICSQHLKSEPIPPSERRGNALPAALEGIVLQCLEKDPADRPQTAAELRAQLRAIELGSAWDEDRARTWWDDNRTKLKALRSPEPASATAMTVEVDVGQRLAGFD